MLPYEKKLTGHARRLRKNMTPEEKRVWYDLLKRLPITAQRQRVIGHYIVDFYIASRKLVVEIDGLQHEMDKSRENDRKRDSELASLGINVVRYRNEDVKGNFDLVADDLLRRLGLTYMDLKEVKS